MDGSLEALASKVTVSGAGPELGESDADALIAYLFWIVLVIAVSGFLQFSLKELKFSLDGAMLIVLVVC